MSVITFSREPYSGGMQIAQSVAEKLGYRLATKKTIEEVLLQYGFVDVEEAYDSMPNFWTRFDERTHQIVTMFDRVIRSLAKLGNIVIVGRGAFKVLAPYRDVLHIRIKGPFPQRVSTYMTQCNTSDRQSAENAIAEADRIRYAFLEVHYGIKWDSMTNFDLIIDTGKISPHSAVPLVIEAHKAAKSIVYKPEESTTSIEEDKILLESTRSVIEGR
jgi:cytidylate kinase